MPGGVFHLTARTLKRERVFTPGVRTEILASLARSLPISGARLLAVAIMANHVHLVVQQGEDRLARLMQSWLRRVVHIVHRRHGTQGPVFWRPYSCAPCLDPEHARNAIVYTHLNPVRAGICTDPAWYPWSSHHLFLDGGMGALQTAERTVGWLRQILDPSHAVPLFASGPDRSLDQLRRDYADHIAWRLALDRWQEGDGPPPPFPGSSSALPEAWGELRWSRGLTPLFHVPATPGVGAGGGAPRPDLADIARVTLAIESGDLSLDLIRGRRGGKEVSRLRHRIVERAHHAGYRNVEIARFLDLSESAVSKVLCSNSSG